MSFFGIFPNRKQEVLLTDEERRKTHAVVNKTKGVLDEQYASLSRLVEEALVELKDHHEQHQNHPHQRQQ
jgi:hypothetical protein